MSNQPEALRLADNIEAGYYGHCPQAAAELRRLYTDAEESEALRDRLSELLRNTAIALRGPEPELTRWSWHDLPELATALKAQRDALLEALRIAEAALSDIGDADREPGDDVAWCEARAAEAIPQARAAIKAVEEQK